MIEFPLRTRHDLSSGWEFIRGKVGRRWLGGGGRPGQSVDLPHCWNLDDTYQYDRNSYKGFGGYRRQVHLPAAPWGASWHLCSEGFYGVGEIRLDGRSLTRFDGQYLGFDIALPNWSGGSDLTLGIRLDNRFHRNVLPGKRQPDFLLYGGLVGRLWFEQKPIIHIAADRVEIVCSPGPDGSELLELRTALNEPTLAEPGGRLTWSVTTGDGSVVASLDPTPLQYGVTSTKTSIANPRCWSPDDPHLHWAEGRLETDGGPADIVRVRFGITRAEFRPREGFFLDGQRTDLHGVNRHESVPGLGSALPPELHRSDARLLKRYGCNFVRLSHYPQHPAFLDACDELGIMVYAELASWKSVRSSPGWRRAARRQLHDLIIRDRHHPSVILWGMGNESRSRKAYLELRRLARELDPNRPVTYAENHLYRARRQKTVGIPDVWATNYELDALDEARDSSRLQVVVLSECCNHPTSIKGAQDEELTQVLVIEREWGVMAKCEGLAGHAMWSFADYATEYRDRTRRQTGLFDAWRRPKMAAELFRARYADEPFISLFMTRNQQKPELHIFTNCHGIRVIRQGSPNLNLDDVMHHIVSIDDDWSALSVEGFRNEQTVHQELRAWGEPTDIRVKINESKVETGRTVAIDLSICDDRGTIVQNWNGHIRVAVSEDARLFSYTREGEVLMARGEGRVYLEIGDSGGPIVIGASADGLETVSRTLSRRE